MRDETMTSQERLEYAINLEKPDRVPVSFLNNTSAAASLIGEKYWEIAQQGYMAHVDVELKFFDAYGGWDGFHLPLAPDIYYMGGLKLATPTESSPEIQILEEELMTIEDYEYVTEYGMADFIQNQLIERAYGKEGAQKAPDIYREAVQGARHGKEEYVKKGAYLLFPSLQIHPFFKLSLSRSMVKFTEDLYYRPELVEKALQKMTDEFIEMGIKAAKRNDALTMGVIEERAGGFFYPMKIFERFWWPYTKQIVNAFQTEGIKAWFHLDTSWDKNIHYFKELPKRSAIIDLDGTTNIFAAKEQLRGHLAISSDVHPTLLSLGTPEDVEAYCKKVIDEVGDDGGLVLFTGCSLPVAVKKENFEAMLRTGKTYELSKA